MIGLDEKPVSLHGDVRLPLPARPGQVAKRDNEYKRCGTANVFCAVEPKAGRHFTFPTPDRSAPEWARVLDRIIRGYPFARTIHLVMDNLNIHCRKSLTDHSESTPEAICGAASPFITRPSTAAGSTKPKSKSASSPGSASAAGEFPVWTCCGVRPAHGTGR